MSLVAYEITREFTGGALVGLHYTSVQKHTEGTQPKVGTVVAKPIGGSPYRIVAVMSQHGDMEFEFNYRGETCRAKVSSGGFTTVVPPIGTTWFTDLFETGSVAEAQNELVDLWDAHRVESRRRSYTS
jgi:hypothetical protein